MRAFPLTILLSFASAIAMAEDCVILLHGIARSPGSMSSLQQALEKEGYTAESFAYPDREQDLSGIVTAIEKPLTTFATKCPGKVHFVTHSMGGLVARAFINMHRPANLGSVVMLAPPNQGSEVADYLATNPAYKSFFGPAGAQLTTTQSISLTALLGTPNYPLGIIAGNRSVNIPASQWILPGDDDGAVTVSRTQISGMTDFLVLPVTHTFMMNSPEVHTQTLHFLKTNSFQH